MAINLKQYLNLGDVAGGSSLRDIDTSSAHQDLFTLVNTIVRNIYVLVTIILFIFILIGGLGMIINAGNAEKQKQSSKTVTSALTGFLIIFLSYWILKLVELITGSRIITLI